MSFYVVRPHPRKPGFATGEWLEGTVDESEALALLNDPRDTIQGVYSYSERYGQFDNKWHRNDRRVREALKA